MTHQETQAHTTQFCINCTHFRHVGLMKDQQYLCGYGASHNVVTGAPAIEESTGCFQMRATDGRCGPSAALFEPKSSAVAGNRVSKQPDLPVNRHSLNESGQQNRVGSGVTVPQNSVDLGYCSAQVIADNFSGTDCGTTD